MINRIYIGRYVSWLAAIILYMLPLSELQALEEKPSKPLNVAVTVKNGITTIRWSKPSSSGIAKIKRYTAVSVQDGVSCSAIGPSAKKCNIKKLSSIVREFRVYAINKYGAGAESDLSNPTISSKNNVDASCGTSSNLYVTAPPTSALDQCLAGQPITLTSDPDNLGRYSWTCVGYGNGRNTSCQTQQKASLSTPRDLTSSEKEYFSELLLKTIPTYLTSPSSFKVVTGPKWSWYRSFKPAEGSWEVYFDSQNGFGAMLRTRALCPMKFMDGGYWTFDYTATYRLCYFY